MNLQRARASQVATPGSAGWLGLKLSNFPKPNSKKATSFLYLLWAGNNGHGDNGHGDNGHEVQQ